MGRAAPWAYVRVVPGVRALAGRPWIARLVVGALLVGAVAAGVEGSQRMGRKVEEPRHEVVLREGDFEVRAYAPRVLAATRVVGDRDAAASEGFRRLAGYIFGGNRRGTASTSTAQRAEGERIAMTAPVGQTPEGERIAMTAPVGQTPEGTAWTVSFTMPAGRTVATLPEPLDARVTLRALAPERVASLRFSGRTTQTRIDAETARLEAWVRAHGWRSAAPPEVNRYDPPWTLPFLRRNEIWVTLAAP
jgi:hypothetical protein